MVNFTHEDKHFGVAVEHDGSKLTGCDVQAALECDKNIYWAKFNALATTGSAGCMIAHGNHKHSYEAHWLNQEKGFN